MHNIHSNKVSDVLETRDYSIFTKVKGNREVSKAHVNKLVKKMDVKFLSELPIVVGPMNKNGKYPILDGQHSAEAREKRNKPIRFFIASHIRADDISDLNTDKSNWKDRDYLNKYVQKGNEHYLFYQSMMGKYSCLNAKYAFWTTVCNGNCKRRTALDDLFKKGLFSLTEADKKNVIKVADFFKDVFQHLPKPAKITMFMFALLQAMETPGFDKKHFVKKVKKQSNSFLNASNTELWYEKIAEVYNKYTSKRKQLSFPRWNQINPDQ
tara:strand:+ start:212 stop:1012 length:801 start_codon:yes stop_codon:yes gene_type:complete